MRLKGLLFCGALAVSSVAFARGGDFDTTFGAGGVATLPAGEIRAVGLRVDGSSVIVLAGQGQSLVRRLPDGSPDSSFGSAGSVTLDAAFPVDIAAAAIQPDGKVVVAGAPRPPLPTCLKLRVARLNTDGSVDSTFAVAGRWDSACLPLVSLVDVQVAVLDSGRIMAIAYPYQFWSMELGMPVIVRLSDSGRPDPDYGVDGIATAPFRDLYGPADARIFGDGSVEFVRYELAPAAAQDYVIWSSRMLANGAIGMTQDGSSETRLPTPIASELGFRVAVLSDRTRLVSAISPERGDRANISRYGPDGRPLQQFGDAGTAVVTIVSNSRIAHEIATPDRGFLLVLNDRYAFEAYVLVKVDEFGNLDPAFGTAGRVDISVVPGQEFPMDVSMQRDGYAFVAGGAFAADGGSLPGYLARIQAIGDVVEFYHPGLGHYFMATDDTEARGIDAGAAGAGWIRTGMGFRPGGTTPLCRFYGTPGIGPNSHFYTADHDECELVKTDPGWTLEGFAFFVTPVVAGGCRVPLRAVHRLYNNRWMFNDSNHRYVTDLALIPAMTQAGWIHEGVVFCAKP